MATVKVIEIMGASDVSWEDAVKNAVKSATRTISDVRGVDVVGWTAQIGSDGEITEYHANCKIAFVVRES
jgi:flavin-binding protein dodecin